MQLLLINIPKDIKKRKIERENFKREKLCPCPVFPLEMTTARLFVVGFEVSFDDIFKKIEPRLYDLVMARRKSVTKKKLSQVEPKKVEREIESELNKEAAEPQGINLFLNCANDEYENSFNCQPVKKLLNKILDEEDKSEISKHEGLYMFLKPHDDDRKIVQYGQMRNLIIAVPLSRTVSATDEFYAQDSVAKRYHELTIDLTCPETDIDDLQEIRHLIMDTLKIEETPDIKYISIRNRCNCC